MNFDLVFRNGKIRSIDGNFSVYTFLGVKNGKIVALEKADIADFSAKDVVDLEGKTVLPGLMDCHVHVLPAGLGLSAVQLEKAGTIKNVLELLEDACKKAPQEDEWVFGAGYISQSIKESRYPNKDELDKISNGKKIIIMAATLHGCALNTAAMEVCRIPENLPGVEKENGVPIGIYSSDESSFLANARALGDLSDEKLWGYIEDCATNAAAQGVTTMHGLFGMFVENDRDVPLIVERASKLPIEMCIWYQTWEPDEAKALGLPRVGGCLTLDGASFEYTMANFAPYKSAPGLRGVLYHTDEEVYRVVRKAHEMDMQITLHALGDRAIDQLIWTYHRVFSELGRKPHLRHRIEHFSYPTDEQIKMLVDLDLIASIQPGFTHYWDRAEGGEFEFMFGRKGADRWDPFNKLFAAGCKVCSGSDCPVTPVEPLIDIATIVNGPNPIRNAGLDDAIKTVTINAAYAANLDERKGSLEPGKDADLVVLDKDPYDVWKTKEIHNIRPLLTLREGKIIYKA